MGRIGYVVGLKGDLVRLLLTAMRCVKGDLDGNARRHLDLLAAGRAAGCDLVLLPEMSLTGYDPEAAVRVDARRRDCAGGGDSGRTAAELRAGRGRFPGGGRRWASDDHPGAGRWRGGARSAPEIRPAGWTSGPHFVPVPAGRPSR